MRTKTSSFLGRKESDLKKSKKIGHRRVTDQGTVTYKKTPTSEIQRAIQLGIQHSICTLQQKPVRDVLFRDFEVIETVDFPRSGTKTTPAHALSDFRFRTIAPVAFRSFRDGFQLDIRDYLLIVEYMVESFIDDTAFIKRISPICVSVIERNSQQFLCSSVPVIPVAGCVSIDLNSVFSDHSLCSQELRELSNPGASGSIFYITADDEFIIKTVQHKEANFLQKLLPEYYMNLVQHTRTLLPKFYGYGMMT
ncbi:hypothetical protein ACTXT7_008062 [Hymenolepis weldensis]